MKIMTITDVKYLQKFMEITVFRFYVHKSLLSSLQCLKMCKIIPDVHASDFVDTKMFIGILLIR